VGSLSGLGLDELGHTQNHHHHKHKRSGSVIPPRRLIVFVVGGVTRGEMREAHALSRELGREVLIGGTEVFTPETFMGELARLGGGFSGALARNDEEVDLDDIVIE
jgi:syntaxin-binding protein 1